MTDNDTFVEPPVFYCTDAIHRDIQDRARAEATAAAEQRLRPSAEPLDDRDAIIAHLKAALTVASHSPHDQAGEPVEGFPVCSVCGAIQTSPSVEPAGLDVERSALPFLSGSLSPPSPEMNERERAIELANRILDRPSGDPDDDLSILSRQLLRAIEPPEWSTERQPGDDEECERLGCEDRTHPVHHRSRLAVLLPTQASDSPEKTT